MSKSNGIVKAPAAASTPAGSMRQSFSARLGAALKNMEPGQAFHLPGKGRYQTGRLQGFIGIIRARPFRTYMAEDGKRYVTVDPE